jgi:hypothetical protein
VSPLPIYISTCNEYLKVLRITLWLFREHWPEFSEHQVKILGYNKPDFPLASNIEFVSMGQQIGGPAMWSSDLRKIFENSEETFIYTMDDMFVDKRVDATLIDELTDIVVSNPEVVRASLVDDPGPFSTATNFCKKNGYDVVQLSQMANYRNSTQPSIWRKEYLLKFMKPGLTPWKFELEGMEQAKNDGKIVIGTKGSFAMSAHEGVRVPPRGRGPQYPNLSPISPDCILRMQSEGVI